MAITIRQPAKTVTDNRPVDQLPKTGPRNIPDGNERRLITTRLSSCTEDTAAITHPIFREFAYRWNADFLILQRDCEHSLKPTANVAYKLCRTRELFLSYDRIFHIDSDLIISPHCPNIFEEVPADKLGIVMEDKGSRQDSRVGRMNDLQIVHGDIGWRSGYPNAGLLIFSAPHAVIFNDIDGSYWEEIGFDCVHIGYNIKRFNIPFIDLGYKWNHMSMFSEEWNGSPDRFKSHIIHYAGVGIFEPGIDNKLEQMKKDVKVWWGK